MIKTKYYDILIVGDNLYAKGGAGGGSGYINATLNEIGETTLDERTGNGYVKITFINQ